ncbi:MAG TPA: hypothetical protein QF468_04405 [Nitrospinota bacterium]|jgi:hypothetical protein|nr:hypothetical protein [Nitrospinota bacterium]|tara:strand:+ start:328 stop:474 length:147 start_codon:yes stop_codon:yes gene_type:complete
MKIAFIYRSANQSMPLGRGYLSSILKQEGFEVLIFTLTGFNDETCLKK